MKNVIHVLRRNESIEQGVDRSFPSVLASIRCIFLAYVALQSSIECIPGRVRSRTPPPSAEPPSGVPRGVIGWGGSMAYRKWKYPEIGRVQRLSEEAATSARWVWLT